MMTTIKNHCGLCTKRESEMAVIQRGYVMYSMNHLYVILSILLINIQSNNAFSYPPFSNIKIHKRSIGLDMSQQSDNNVISHDALSEKHILVVGGSGRVGGSVVTQILKHGTSFDLFYYYSFVCLTLVS